MSTVTLPRARSVAVNLVAFQVCWVFSVMAAAAGAPWIGPAVIVCWLMLHLSLASDVPKREVQLCVLAAVVGWIADSLLVFAGVMTFPHHAQLGAPSTLWMAALWAGFAATVPHSLGWLHQRLCLAAVLGAIAGPLAYFAGERLGAIELASSKALLAVSVVYALLTPALMWVWRRMGIRPLAPSALTC